MKKQDEKQICIKGEDKHTKVENVFATDDTKPNEGNNESVEKKFKKTLLCSLLSQITT